MIGGITLFAGFYALSLMIAAATMQNQGDFKLLFIPVGGPFIVAAGLRGCEVCTAMRVPMILDGLLQTAGATMFAVAVSSGGEKILKRNDVARATPRVSLGPASASLRWTF